MLAQRFLIASAAIVLLLGVAHLLLTYFSRLFSPRDAALEERLKVVSPRISKQTTMWRAQTGFHVSHSLGAILFGLVYGYLALVHFTFLLQSGFLMTLGLVTLLIYAVLGKLYWFSRPFRGILLALACYVVGVVLAHR